MATDPLDAQGQVCMTCHISYTGSACPDCRTMSEDEKIDQLVSRASVPNLASLFRAGKKAGLIKPVQDYAGSAAS